MNDNFHISKTISTVHLEDKFLENKVMQYFLKDSILIYVLKNEKYYGVIVYENYEMKKFNAFDSIETNYPFIFEDSIKEDLLNEILFNDNKIYCVPVCDNSKNLIYEYRKLDFKINPLAIDKKRWNYLYKYNNKISDLISSKKLKRIVVTGKLKSHLKKYIDSHSSTKCETYSGDIFNLMMNSDSSILIIDTDNLKSQLVEYMLTFKINFKNKKTNYISLNNLCDEAELYYFTNFVKENKIKTFFFLCQTPGQLSNLNFSERLRISYDKHYRYYLENMNKDINIDSVVKMVLGELYTSEFISSRNSMSGTILKDGVCFLAPSNNQFCGVIKGLRCTTDHNYKATNKINMFGPCLFFGPLQDDERTIPSYIQRLVNNNLKNYWIDNYGQRAISMYENIRTCFSIEIHENDVLIFAISPDEKEKLNKYGIENIHVIADMLNSEVNFHDYFMGEPIHCNHIANEKIAKYIYSKIESDLFDFNNTPSNNKIIVSGNKNSIFENNKELKKYISDLKKMYASNKGIIGAVMMNCNPFTKGHYNLIEFASKKVDKLFVFVVQEDKSYFSFEDRINMVKAGCNGFTNVIVVGSGKIFGSYMTFPTYFNRDDNANVEIDVSMDIELFTEYIAPALNIKKRFVGDEPADNITKKYNDQIKKELPKFGIECIEIPRFSDDCGKIISAKFVRKALEEGDWLKVKRLVPSSVLQILEKYKKDEKIL